MKDGNSSTSENKRINSKVDLKIEGELSSVWRAFREAISSGNAQAALYQISVSSRAEEAQTYKALGNKLRDLANVLEDIESVEIRGESEAIGQFYRHKEAIINGQTVKIDNGCAAIPAGVATAINTRHFYDLVS